MKTPSPSSSLPLPLPQANGYYSAEDEARMQALVRALLQGRRSIALSSASNEVLDHYSRLLVRDLRQHEHVKVVAHLPGSCDKLVQQVNDLLADLPLAHGVARGGTAARPAHVFVVHDSPALSSAEFALLVRLVNDLPGANLRIALIQDRDFAVTGNLQTLGAQALHWRIQVAGMPASASTEASRQALREALREAPDTLPPWAQPADPAVARRRWRWAFWRRAEPAVASRPATAAAAARKPAASKAARPLAPAAARVGAKAKSAPPSGRKAVARTSAARTTVRPENTAARRNRVVLASGFLLSAALAGALGTWLSIQPAAQRASKPATPITTTPSNSPTAAATVAMRVRP
ncbi:MAG: hypothetical protein RIS88_2877 [Pseudomonadota bacterium]|jgi:hypothetical protein